MDHQKLEMTASTTPMLPKEEEKMVYLTPTIGPGKILIREDTILANLQGCAGCGRAQFACAGMTKQWSALCWGRPSDTKYYCLLVLLTVTFVLSLLGTVFFCFTNTINDAILSNMIIRNNSAAFDVWRRPTVQPLMKVHIFNYTNWQAVKNGEEEKLRVEDVGPYVYSQQVERVNIEFDGDQLSYQERNTFRYLPERSNGSSMDRVYVPNLPLLGTVSISNEMKFNFLTIPLVTLADHSEAFVGLPAHSFLWGYKDSIVDVVKLKLTLDGKPNIDKFGLLATRNGTVSDRFTINTGEINKDRMNTIEKFNGETHLNYWATPQCNSIEATDGSMFPPSILDRKHPLQVFFPNLCRRIPFQYEKDVEITDGILLQRYRMPNKVFDDARHNGDNECYCDIESSVCPPRGVINVAACNIGRAPIMASWPHFHLGDPQLREDVGGLNPEAIDPQNYLDLHPTLGIALGGKSSLQLNIQVKMTSLYNALTFLKEDMILPIAWVEVGIEELPDNLRLLVYHGTYSTAAAQLGLMVFSIISLLVSSTCLCLLLRRRRKPCATIKTLNIETELKAQS